MSSPDVVDTVRISTTSGRIHVSAEPDLDHVRSSAGAVAVDGGVVTIDGTSDRIRLSVPEGTDLVVGTTSGRVQLEGRLGAVSVVTASGRISIDEATSVDVRTTSGRVAVGRVSGECRANGRSGSVEIGCCSLAEVTTTSGRIVVRDAAGPVQAHCVSGRIDIELSGAFDVEAEAVSGRIGITLPPEARPLVVSTRDTSPSPEVFDCEGYDCVVTARSVSGRIAVSNR